MTEATRVVRTTIVVDIEYVDDIPDNIIKAGIKDAMDAIDNKITLGNKLSVKVSAEEFKKLCGIVVPLRK